MYSNRENTLPENVLVVALDTAEGPVLAVDTLRWAASVVDFLRSIPVGDGEPDIEIRHLGHGSTSLELVFLGAVAFGSVGMFAIALHEALTAKEPQEVARTTRDFAINYDAENVTITHVDTDPIIIQVKSINVSVAFPSRQSLGGSDQIGGDSASPVVDDDAPQYEQFDLEGRIVTTDGGRFAEFRAGDESYRIGSPEDLLQQIPIGEDIYVVASWSDSGRSTIDIETWSYAGDEQIDWENAEGRPGTQVEKLAALERRAEWSDKTNSYEDRIPKLKGDYPAPDSLAPALPGGLRVVDAADANIEPEQTALGQFAVGDNGVLYFGTSEYFGPVANPEPYWGIKGQVEADYLISGDEAGEKFFLVIKHVSKLR